MGEGVVLWPVFPSHRDNRSTFFSWFEIFRSEIFQEQTFFQLRLYLSIQNIRSFLVLILASADDPRHLESKVPLPCGTSKAKKAVSHSLEGV